MFKRKFSFATVLALLVLAPSPALSADTITGADEAACTSGKSAVLVTVHGFKSDVGLVRVQLYGPDPAAFLAKGEWVERAERPRDRNAAMRFCLPVPHSGQYAVAVRHDANGNGQSDWNDGAGFSRNPGLSLFNLKPAWTKVAIDIGNDVRKVDVTMQYRSGLTIKPVE